jgi:hypothetical protein
MRTETGTRLLLLLNGTRVNNLVQLEWAALQTRTETQIITNWIITGGRTGGSNLPNW